ncbi:MAG: T9SS type A sorting domain-containing protein [Flavobacterium sp.]
MKKLHLILLFFCFLGKINAQAPSIIWQKTFGGTNMDSATAITQTTDGGYAFVAFTDSANGDVTQNHGETDLWVVKVTESGDIQWQKSFGGSRDEYGRRIKQTSDGGYIIIATTLSNDGDITHNYGESDYWIVKLDNSGVMEWQKSYGGISVDDAYDIKQTLDGGYIVVGNSVTILNSFAANHIGNSDVWLVKLNALGNIEWENSSGGESNETAMAVSQTIDGGYIVASHTWSNIGAIGGHADNDFFVVKYTATGSVEWQRVIGGSGNEYVFDILQLNDGSYVVAGNTTSTDNGILNHGMQDGFVVKLDDNGEPVWQKTFGGTEYDGFEDVEITSDNKIILSGYTHSYNGDVTDYHGGQDAWVVEINTNGELQWQKTFGSTDNEGIQELHQTVDGGFIMAGLKLPLYGNLSTRNCWIVKLNSGALSTDTFENAGIKLYPNPVEETFRIDLTEDVTLKSIRIYNLLGQLVQLFYNPAETMSVSGLSSGNYLIKITTDKGTSTGKFIKQ